MTSILVAAAWTLGIPAVTEVKSLKIRPHGDSDGRIDALFDLQNSQLAVESKIYWFNNEGSWNSVLGRLLDAEIDARAIDPAFIGRRLAIVFGVLEKGGDSIESLIRIALRSSKTCNADLFLSVADYESDETVLYPGCIMVGSLV